MGCTPILPHKTSLQLSAPLRSANSTSSRRNQLHLVRTTNERINELFTLAELATFDESLKKESGKLVACSASVGSAGEGGTETSGLVQ